MALPAGFNPNDMSFGNMTKRAPIFEIPRNTSTYSSYTSLGSNYHVSFWSRFNKGVASIGNWFAEKSEDVLGWVSIIAIAIIVLACLAKVITTWIDEGFWMALLMAFGMCIVGAIAWFVATLAIIIGVNAIMYGFRFIFWNGWSLLMTVMLAAGIWIYVIYGPSYYEHDTLPQTEVYIPTYDRYRCTAAILNVRIHPNKNSRVLGVLHQGQEVEVIDKEKGFAAIEYNGQRGYASLKYLTKID